MIKSQLISNINMKIYFISFLICFLFLIIVDALWLGLIAKNFYSLRIGHLMSSSFKFWPAFIFYPLYTLALVLLVIWPAIEGGQSFSKVFFLGFILGLVAYGAYDLTNQAVLKDWPIIVTVVDMLWGSLLAGSASLVTYYSVVNYFSL